MFDQIKRNLRSAKMFDYIDEIATKMYIKDGQVAPVSAVTERNFNKMFIGHFAFLMQFFAEQKWQAPDLTSKFEKEIDRLAVIRSFSIPAALYLNVVKKDKSTLDDLSRIINVPANSITSINDRINNSKEPVLQIAKELYLSFIPQGDEHSSSVITLSLVYPQFITT